jgi:LPXTG-motif cell wall-anchored protein
MNLLARLATATVGGAAVLAMGAPAAAHEDPQHEGFNAVLRAPHHDKLATDETWPDCETVRDRLEGDADRLITDGHDVWVFYIPDGTFDTEGAVARIEFRDPDGTINVADMPGGAYESWIGPGDAETHLAIAIPAGWTLADGEFAVAGSEHMVEVKRTCPDAASQATDGGGGSGLPVTGAQVGGMLILGGGLLAAGIAMSAVKRRRDLWDLLGDDAHHPLP